MRQAWWGNVQFTGDFVEWEGGAGLGPAIAPIEQEMAVNAISGAEDEEDSDNGNEKVKDYSEGEGNVLHGGEGPGHRGWWGCILVFID